MSLEFGVDMDVLEEGRVLVCSRGNMRVRRDVRSEFLERVVLTIQMIKPWPRP